MTRLTLAAAGRLPAPVRWSLLVTALLLGSSASVAWAATARAMDAAADYSAHGPDQVETREISVPRGGADDPFDTRPFVPVPTEAELARDERSAPHAFGHGYLSPIRRSALDARTQRTYGQAVLTAWIRGAVMDDASAAAWICGKDPTGIANVEVTGVEAA